jgi:hypothetical protein
MAIPIREFAFRKQAPIDAVVNAALDGTVTYVLLSDYADIPILSQPGGDFTHSLMGSLVAPAIIIAFVISLLTSRTTIKKRIKGEVTPPLDPGVSWSKRAWQWGLSRAVLNVFVVYGLGGLILQVSPDLRVSRAAAATIVFFMAGVLAYVESASGVLRTPNAR